MSVWPKFRGRALFHDEKGREGADAGGALKERPGSLKRAAASTRRERKGRKTRPRRSRQRGQGRPARSNLRQSRRRHENPEPTSPSRETGKKKERKSRATTDQYDAAGPRASRAGRGCSAHALIPGSTASAPSGGGVN